ncbi:alpha/beta-hydrolase [Pluteus cervinus]|uniref:Alpha/beta-hydrolase n=1 Tax=Pluteus cervinus TaxID=181527 RepID=A0ACD3B9K0_9AGAR|nr:alpha/beta-hydrolase [Pluteus cervinus]
MRFPFSLLGLSTQLPLQAPSTTPQGTMAPTSDFAFKEGPDVFSPRDLVSLGRPGAGVPNDAGDLVLIPYSQYSFDEKKNKKSLVIASLDSNAEPLRIPLEKAGEAFWLNSRTIGHVVEGDKSQELYAITLNFQSVDGAQTNEPASASDPSLITKIPATTASNFRYVASSGYLVFSAYVYEDGNLNSTLKKDKDWEERGTTAFVYDSAFPRHWDTWATPKRPSLFSSKLSLGSDQKWTSGDQYTNLLKGTGHHSPVEPFGGTDDFDVSDTHVIYTTKDPILPEAWHTKQNVYIVDIAGGTPPRELTSGEQAATHGPVFNAQGTKAAWLELDKDGYESDRAKIVIYDLEKDVRYTLTQNWDRSPDGLAFSKQGDYIYLTAGDEAKVKVFVLPIPATPTESTTHPSFSAKYQTPVALTHSRAASGLNTLPGGRILFSQNSLTSPNNVYVIRNLQQLEEEITKSESLVSFKGSIEQVTNLTEQQLTGKNLSVGEEFWFTGAEGKQVQGWALRPKGWKEGETKKWPVAFLIHGGPQGAWEDSWSTRWNPNIFAQQGYFVLMINPTGSTTFGQEFTDAIAEDWGGKPFVDLQAGFKYALQKYPEIDADRAVAAGASWGGYAINWIQGHPEYDFNFKALIAHDGVFDSTYNGYSTDELFFFNHEWGGRPWEPKSKELSQNPSNFVHKWSTPQLLIHGSKDYRLPETESIGVFNALQQLNIPTRLVIFPDENHWVLNHGNSLKWHYEVFRWFDQFVGENSKA